MSSAFSECSQESIERMIVLLMHRENDTAQAIPLTEKHGLVIIRDQVENYLLLSSIIRNMLVMELSERRKGEGQ